MRRIERFEVRPGKLDFSSSGQGPHQALQLFGDGERFSNTLDLVDYDENPIQLELCDACGQPGCASDGHVAFRAAAETVILMPPFTEMEEDDRTFPSYRVKKSAIVVDPEQYAHLRALVPGFPAIATLPPLTRAEATRILQWEAPRQVLGTFPAPVTLLPDHDLTAATEADVAQLLETLQRVIAALVDDATPANIRRIDLEDERVTLWFDDLAEWTPLVRRGAAYHLLLAPDFVIA